MFSDPRKHVSQSCLWVNAVHFGGDDQTIHCSGAGAATIGPAEQPRFASQSDAPQTPLSGIIRKIDTTVIQEEHEGMPALKHISDCFSEIMARGQPGELLAYVSSFESFDEGATGALPNNNTFFWAFAFDVAFDCKENVDAAHDLNSDWGNSMRSRREDETIRSRRRCLLDPISRNYFTSNISEQQHLWSRLATYY